MGAPRGAHRGLRRTPLARLRESATAAIATSAGLLLLLLLQEGDMPVWLVALVVPRVVHI
jgi:hypothetical protein